MSATKVDSVEVDVVESLYPGGRRPSRLSSIMVFSVVVVVAAVVAVGGLDVVGGRASYPGGRTAAGVSTGILAKSSFTDLGFSVVVTFFGARTAGRSWDRMPSRSVEEKNLEMSALWVGRTVVVVVVADEGLNLLLLSLSLRALDLRVVVDGDGADEDVVVVEVVDEVVDSDDGTPLSSYTIFCPALCLKRSARERGLKVVVVVVVVVGKVLILNKLNLVVDVVEAVVDSDSFSSFSSCSCCSC